MTMVHAEAGVERTRQDLEAALRRAKQLAKAEREWEARREETRATLAAREAALLAAQSRLEEAINRTADAILMFYDKEREAAAAETVASTSGGPTPDPVTHPTPEETTDNIMRTVVNPLMEIQKQRAERRAEAGGAPTTTTTTTTNGRKTAAAKPTRAKRSRPAKGKHQASGTVSENDA